MENIVSNLANNQVIIEDRKTGKKEFHSYGTKIAETGAKTLLSIEFWEYSRTTTKYLCRFLGVKNKKAIEQGIEDKVYILTDKF